MEITLSQLASDCASLVADMKAAETKAETSREAANVVIVKLHKAKATIGRYNQCAGATAFMDTLTARGLAKGTSKNYLTVFRDAVKTGKPVTDWNSSRADAKGKGKGGKGKGKASLADLLLKTFNHNEGKTFMALCESIQGQYEDAKVDSVYQGFTEYLKSEGCEITE
jgi:hypothetical protein